MYFEDRYIFFRIFKRVDVDYLMNLSLTSKYMKNTLDDFMLASFIGSSIIYHDDKYIRTNRYIKDKVSKSCFLCYSCHKIRNKSDRLICEKCDTRICEDCKINCHMCDKLLCECCDNVRMNSNMHGFYCEHCMNPCIKYDDWISSDYEEIDEIFG